MARRRTAGAVAVAAALVATLAACGGGGGSGRPTTSPSPSAGSASPTATKSSDRSPQGVMLSAEQVLQTARRAKLSYRFDTPDGKSDSADGSLYWAPRTIMQLTKTNPGATDQLIVMDTVSYQGGDAATAARLGGKHWEKSPEVMGPDGHPVTPFAALVDQLNPLEAVTAAANASDLQKLGEEKLGDSTVEHYTATLSVSDYTAAQQNLLTSDRRDSLAAALGQGGVTTLTLDLWLNDKDQLVQLQRGGSGTKGDLEQVIQYSEFGGNLAVQAPAESDTQGGGS
ncbi:hypothetical protein [Kitasatospora kifunensis]|uniref:Lipoprotein n=1 Tax=Kitasatospora kifunensis TaxID=58351 RepID=A0A7W7R497_KITKI|nr:hypothetical protein [Kitasatospora kifunensis]MBB4925180.1 hypothetical protein [Kitasatospora kifunensis]